MFTQQLSFVSQAVGSVAAVKPFGNVRVNYLPLGKLEVLVRIENLQDSFDSWAETETVDVGALCRDLWGRANDRSATPSFTLTETSVTGNMPVWEMENRRVKWKTQSGGAHFPLSTGFKDGG
jgi:hypothetical protein